MFIVKYNMTFNKRSELDPDENSERLICMHACMQNDPELDKNQSIVYRDEFVPNHINYFCFEIHKVF
jgi:hypothetical protein